MRKIAAGVAVFFLAGSAMSYFQYQRTLQSSGAGQRYFVVDQAIWQHARPDLGDLRLYAGQSETAYTLITQRGSEQEQRTSLPVLQQSKVAGKTQFLINMSALAEYDHVKLDLTAKNFVAHARVEGGDDPHANAKTWAELGDNILYDLSKEDLGSNRVLRLPPTTFKYLRVTLDGPVRPDQVTGATSIIAEKHPAAWRDVSDSPRQEQSGKDTVLIFQPPANCPVDRVLLTVDPAQSNFKRSVEIQDPKGAWLDGGEIDRIHMVRDAKKIDSEDQEVTFSASGEPTIKVIVHNGDDPPLRLSGARLQQLERRVYFDAPASGPLRLYYGDAKLAAPDYDYAKLFSQDNAAPAAQLGPEVANPAYTGRPDDRPWSERHPLVLWAVIIAAVLTLGALALRSMRNVA